MKKILTSVVAAAALLFGLASCSGDLHDKEMAVVDLSAGAVPGDYETPASWDNKTAWTSIDKATNTYVLEFTTKADCNGEVGFKILTVNGEWNVAGFAEPNTVAAGSNAVFTMIDAASMGGAGNAKMTGMKAGKGYKLTAVANPDTTLTVSLEETGAAAVPVPFYLDGYYILGPEAIGGNSDWKAEFDTLLWGATKDNDGNLSYAYTFVAGAEEIQFGIGRKGWADCFNNGSEFKYGTDTEPKVLASGNTANNKISGLTIGDTYILKVYTTPAKEVSFSVTIPLTLTVEFHIAGFEASAEGKYGYVAGEFCGWGWTSAWGGDNKLSHGASGEIDADGTAVLVWKKPVEIGDEIKIGEFCGYFGEEEDNDILSSDGEIKALALSGDDAKNFKCNYTIKVEGAATYVVSATRGGAQEVTCTKK